MYIGPISHKSIVNGCFFSVRITRSISMTRGVVGQSCSCTASEKNFVTWATWEQAGILDWIPNPSITLTLFHLEESVLKANIFNMIRQQWSTQEITRFTCDQYKKSGESWLSKNGTLGAMLRTLRHWSGWMTWWKTTWNVSPYPQTFRKVQNAFRYLQSIRLMAKMSSIV